jgi:hypothetical protein
MESAHDPFVTKKKKGYRDGVALAYGDGQGAQSPHGTPKPESTALNTTRGMRAVSRRDRITISMVSRDFSAPVPGKNLIHCNCCASYE